MSREVTHTKKKMLKATWKLETADGLSAKNYNSYTANLKRRTGLSKLIYYVRNIRKINREESYYRDVYKKIGESIRDEIDKQILDKLVNTLGVEDIRIGI